MVIKQVYRHVNAQHFINSPTPTFFFHGGGSNYHAEEYMTNGAKKAGVTDHIIVANVAKNGHVVFNGQLPSNARNPIIEVNYQNNKEWGHKNSYHIDGDYAYDVVMAARKKWHFQTMNLVGHSMGNIDIMYLLLDHHQQPIPQLKKQVVIAGHFNGGIGFGYPTGSTISKSGRPSKEEIHYAAMAKQRYFYPHGAKVLNIYGDCKDGSHSDGDVPVNSARSLKYLVKPQADTYHEVEIKGPAAQHSRLHHNPQVNRLLINFLWQK